MQLFILLIIHNFFYLRIIANYIDKQDIYNIIIYLFF